MPTLTPITELEAVNAILATIGDTPVNTIVDTGLLNVEQAVTFLHESSRAIQSEGWYFNAETDYPLSPDVNGNIIVPANVLKIDPTREYWSYDLVQRGSKMYDKNEHTDVFDVTIKFNIVFFLAFEEIPQTARQYIMIRAARLFQDRMLGSEALHGYSQSDEDVARANLLDEETENGDYNMITGSYSVAQITKFRT